jgi:cyclin H
MIEDDHYRASTQYRHWSFTSTQLHTLRQQTNTHASTRVLAALQRHHNTTDTTITTNPPTPLTIPEELLLLHWGCLKIHEIGLSLTPSPIPPLIRCTAIQYLRRFYLNNSPMTYHPKQLLTCALYLATKSSHWHVSIGRYISELEGVTEKDVVGLEFLLMQGLRFTLDVRHPVKGLEGGHLELLEMLRGRHLPAKYTERSVNEIVKTARELLRTAAQMTDVYFLYTPAQIWMGALKVADAELITLYISYKASEDEAGALTSIKEKLLNTITACAEILASYMPVEEGDPGFVKEMRRIGKKLHLCRNPETVDGARGKREGVGEDGEKKAKKRKVEREMREKDEDIFGGALKDVQQ